MPSGAYDNYYDKVTQYVTILSGYAQKIEPGVTAKTFRPVAAAEGEEETVFKYIDTASTRAEIGAVTAKLAAVKKVAIVGLGGTGSYVLDFVAKTPVGEIHLFDGDEFLQHNAFRSPGAPSLEELVAKPKKAAYLKGIYDKMRNGIFVHEDLHRAGQRGRAAGHELRVSCASKARPKSSSLKNWESSASPSSTWAWASILVKVRWAASCG